MKWASFPARFFNLSSKSTARGVSQKLGNCVGVFADIQMLDLVSISWKMLAISKTHWGNQVLSCDIRVSQEKPPTRPDTSPTESMKVRAH